MMRFLLEGLSHVRVRTYLVMLVLGTALPIVGLAGFLLDRAGVSQAERFRQEMTSGPRGLPLAMGSSMERLQPVMEGSGRSRALADGGFQALRPRLAAARAAPGLVGSVSSSGGVSRIGYGTREFSGETVGVEVPSEATWTPQQRLLAPLLLSSAALTGVGLGLALLLAGRIEHLLDASARLAISPAIVCTDRASGSSRDDEITRALGECSVARSQAETAVHETELNATEELSRQSRESTSLHERLMSVSVRAGVVAGTSAGFLPGDGRAVAVDQRGDAALEGACVSSVADVLACDHEFDRRPAEESRCWSGRRAILRLNDEGRVVCRRGATEEIDDCKRAEKAAAREAAQVRFNQAQRLQALGRLASGIAHDFNNVLQVIGGALFLIATRPDDAARVARFAALADDATQRGAAITGRLLSLSRKGGLHTGPVDPALLLLGMAEVLGHTLGANVAVRVDAAPGLPLLLADRGQLETVLLNLAANARDAMPGGGVLTLSAAFERSSIGVEVDAGMVSGHDGYVCITVADTGEGMDAATLTRASEPFFTTKDAGCGTGLGLAMAVGFTEQSGGMLRIESAPGMGTTVRIWLPCAVEAARAPVAASKAPRLPRLRGHVLLVDDDAQVCATLSEQLQELGLSVVSACDGAAGLRVLADDAGVTLLVSDLTMPGMDGVALIEAAQRARPGLPAILVTGHSGDEAALALGRAITGSFSVLRKPVLAACLADRIIALLGPMAEV